MPALRSGSTSSGPNCIQSLNTPLTALGHSVSSQHCVPFQCCSEVGSVGCGKLTELSLSQCLAAEMHRLLAKQRGRETGRPGRRFQLALASIHHATSLAPIDLVSLQLRSYIASLKVTPLCPINRYKKGTASHILQHTSYSTYPTANILQPCCLAFMHPQPVIAENCTYFLISVY